MKNKIMLILLLCNFLVFSQVSKKCYAITYKAEYLNNNDNDGKEIDNSEIAIQKREIQKQYIENYSKVELELIFNSEVALFKAKDIMQANSSMYYDLAIQKITGNKTYYKNLLTKQKIVSTNLQGESFSFEIPFEEYKWDVSNETKIINNLKCFKATTFKIIPASLFNQEKRIPIEVWFTTDILGSYGPCGIDGLPGVVLSAVFNNIRVYSTEIKSEKTIEILKPIEKNHYKSENDFNIEILKRFNKIKDNK